MATVRPLNESSGYTCDWGHCDEVATVERHSPACGWLPVCGRHSYGQPLTLCPGHRFAPHVDEEKP
jgi:hypothetical protein